LIVTLRKKGGEGGEDEENVESKKFGKYRTKKI